MFDNFCVDMQEICRLKNDSDRHIATLPISIFITHSQGLWSPFHCWFLLKCFEHGRHIYEYLKFKNIYSWTFKIKYKCLLLQGDKAKFSFGTLDKQLASINWKLSVTECLTSLGFVDIVLVIGFW